MRCCSALACLLSVLSLSLSSASALIFLPSPIPVSTDGRRESDGEALRDIVEAGEMTVTPRECESAAGRGAQTPETPSKGSVGEGPEPAPKIGRVAVGATYLRDASSHVNIQWEFGHANTHEEVGVDEAPAFGFATRKAVASGVCCLVLRGDF